MKTYGISIQANQIKDISGMRIIRTATKQEVAQAKRKVKKLDVTSYFNKIKFY